MSGAESLLPFDVLEARVEEWAAAYRDNQPYPHYHFPELLDPGLAQQLSAEFPAPDSMRWIQYQHFNENKLGKNNRESFPPLIGRLTDELASPRFVAWLSRLTGIDGLLADPDLEGGGMHQSQTGGFLNLHADFTAHPFRHDWHRRCNLILYLNDGWQESWGGALEMWDASMKRRVRQYPPLLNHAVVFTTTEDSYHGFPDPVTCPPGVTRKSLAFYYYTEEPGFQARSTDYRARPGDGWRAIPIWLDKKAVAIYSLLRRRLGFDAERVSQLLRFFKR